MWSTPHRYFWKGPGVRHSPEYACLSRCKHERFIAGAMQGECSGSCSKDPNSLMGVREAFLKAR